MTIRAVKSHYTNPDDLIIPPVNFSLVAKGVYRGSYPDFRNFGFLQKLRLKTVLYICPEDYKEQNRQFLLENKIKLIKVPMNGNQKPLDTIPHESMVEALQHITDTRNHPIYIHCNKGTHRTGVVIGCLRKLQNWCLTSIFEEYRCFAGPEAKQIDEQYIELFECTAAELHSSSFPSWLEYFE